MKIQRKEVAGAAFAHVKAGKCKFNDEALRSDIFGKRNDRKYGLFPQTLEAWEGELTALAQNFVAGRAEVDPKDQVKTCKYCDLGALCRVAEFAEPADDEDEDSGDDE